MNTYEFITPSDRITFKAQDDKIAYACALVLGNGKAGCKKSDGTNLQTMLMCHPEPMEPITSFLGKNLDDFIEGNLLLISECLESFAYTSITGREQYDRELEAISDLDEKQKFKLKHEDANRTSMSKWVQQAWIYGELLKNKNE